jgi:Transport and Golgi organisation 2
MCTVSWIHTPGGYHLLCNRDEKKTRASALGPRIQARGWVRFIAPMDTEFGGTWIAVNEFGVSVCLLNGANLTGGPLPTLRQHSRSRGLLVRELIWAQSIDECALCLKQLDLAPFAPFTVVFLQPNKPATIAEWDGDNTTVIPSGESLMPLTSSSFDPEDVRKARWSEFARRAAARGDIDPALLHAFHASHGTNRDAYSTCMHRADAETVSFSWIIVDRDGIRFTYCPGPACAANRSERQEMRRAA